VPDGIAAAGFQDVDESGDVAVHISLGVDQAVAHPRLCRQVANGIKVFACKEPADGGSVFQGSFQKPVPGKGGALG